MFEKNDSKVAPTTVEIDWRRFLFVLRILTGCQCLVGVASVVTGSLVMYYARSKLTFPFATASGIWTGCVIFSLGCFGLYLASKYDVNNPAASAKGFRIFYIINSVITWTIHMHLTYSGIGLGKCAGNSDDCPENRNTLIILESICLAIGVLILALSIAILCHMGFQRRAARMVCNQEVYNRKCCC